MSRFEKWWQTIPSDVRRELSSYNVCQTAFQAAEAEAKVVIDALETALFDAINPFSMPPHVYQDCKSAVELAAEWKKQGGRDD